MSKTVSTSYALSLKSEGAVDPDLSRRLQIYLQHDIQDRWEGMADTVEIWGAQPNMQFISKVLSDANIRLQVAEVFIRRETIRIIEKMLSGLKQVKPEDVSCTKEQVVSAISSIDGISDTVASVVAELMLPSLLEKGMVNANISYSRHIRYGFGRVTVDDIALDVAMHQVSEAVNSAKVSSIDRSTRYSIKPLAEAFGEALRPIGLALMDVNDLTPIVEDMVKGVRAHLDPSGAVTRYAGTVSKQWRDHPVVEELSHNLTFIRAALSLPSNSLQSLAIVSESWRLEKWAPIILAAIKSSTRYAWIGKQEALKHYTLRKIRTVTGVPVTCVLSREMKVQPVAQTVFAVKDAIVSSATNISAMKDRVAEAVQVAYGKAQFSVDAAASMFSDLLKDAVEAGWNRYHAVYSFGSPLRAGEVAEGHASDIAALLSERLYVEVDEEGVIMDKESISLRQVLGATQTAQIFGGTQNPTEEDVSHLAKGLDEWGRLWRPKWWFVIPTKEKALNVMSGLHHGTEVVTSDPAEAMLAADEFSFVSEVPARAQVLGPKAFSTRVIDFDPSDHLRRLNNKFSFSIMVNDVAMRGTFSAQEFGSLKTGVYTSLVIPHFNNEVIDQVRAVFTAAKQAIDSMQDGSKAEAAWLQGSLPGDPFFSFIQRRLARELLKLSQQLSPAFRQDVHRTIVERSILASAQLEGKIGPDDAMILRAQLQQKTFAACVDIIALQFFLDVQGFNAEGWDELVNSGELMRVCMEQGSDR